MFEPRIRLCATILVMLATLCSATWPEILGLTGLFLAVSMLAKTPAQRIARNLLLVAWLALFTLGAHVLGTFNGGAAAGPGLQAGVIAACRLLLLVGWGTVLGASASPLTLVAALEHVCAPLRRLGIPVQSLTLVAMLSLRFLPILLQEQQVLVRAQIARGLDLTHIPYPTRMKLYVWLGAPLLRHLFRRVEHLSAAMESRGFQVNAARTGLRQTCVRRRDYLLLGGSALILVGAMLV